MEKDLTKGPILKTLLLFALPMILGNLLQQIYNITDTIIVGRVLGSGAGCRWQHLYTDDLSNFRYDRTLHGMWHIVFHALWCRSSGKNERMHVGLLLADLCCHPRHVPHCLHRYRRDSESPADSGRHLPSDADIFPHYIPWHWLYVFCTITLLLSCGRLETPSFH